MSGGGLPLLRRRPPETASQQIGLLAVAMPAYSADVTYERLLNSAAAEPQNWLMVHRDYNNSRHSPLTVVNKDNAKDRKPKFIFSIGGKATGGTLPGKEEGTPLVEDGFMYVADTWGRLMKFDVRSGTNAVPLWHTTPTTKARTNRGIAMYGDKVIVSTITRIHALHDLANSPGSRRHRTDGSATGTPSAKTQGSPGAPLAIKTAGGKEL
jgi:alcohol dehydrogenase (cytochrome c)